mmetsp:Transcript_12181/g.13889  ORF Transcript_12181/g.13889 Transcript_12181/m.13889 type:complete len:119 (-) Transcript_12181:70-426(-)
MIFFDKACEFISSSLEEGGKVLVHCFAGKSRSSTFVLAYLMKVKQMNLADAFTLLKSKREQCEPNIGFIVQLKAFEKTLFGTCSKFDWLPKKYVEEKIKEEIAEMKSSEDDQTIPSSS